MIFLTEVAAKKICEIAQENGIIPQVRVRVVGGGCAGFSHDFTFEENVTEMDELFETDGVIVVIDAISLSYADGSVIDWVKMGVGEGFSFNNPNSKGTCGCGNSFSA